MKEVRVVQMFVQFQRIPAGLAAAMLAAAPAHAQGVGATAGSLFQQLGDFADAAGAAIAQSTGIKPDQLRAGLIGFSIAIALLALWLLLRRPRRAADEAASETVQPMPDLRARESVRAAAPPQRRFDSDVSKRQPRLLEAVAAMKAERTLDAAKSETE